MGQDVDLALSPSGGRLRPLSSRRSKRNGGELRLFLGTDHIHVSAMNRNRRGGGRFVGRDGCSYSALGVSMNIPSKKWSARVRPCNLLREPGSISTARVDGWKLDV